MKKGTFATLTHTLSAAVATSGTFQVAYPTGFTAGDFAKGVGHKMIALQALMTCPEDFTVAFGASAATITYLGATTLPQGSTVRLQLERPGDGLIEAGIVTRAQNVRLALIDFGSPAAADRDGICAAQTTGAAADLTLNGVSVNDAGVAVPDVPRGVSLYSSGNLSGITFTLEGVDMDGREYTETMAGPNNTTVYFEKMPAEVTRVASGAAVGTAVEVGWSDYLACSLYVQDRSQVLAEIKDGAVYGSVAGGDVFIPFEIEQTELLAPTNEQVVMPVAGNIMSVQFVIQGAVTTGGALTAKIGTTDIAGISVTVADGATAGTTYSDVPTTLFGSDTLVARGDRVQIVPAAAFDTAGSINGLIQVRPTAAGRLNGTLTPGLSPQTAETAINGDVLGSYLPPVACDGATAWALLVALPDPEFRGVERYNG